MATIVCEKSFAVDAQYSNFYDGGDIAWSTDGSFMYCLNTTVVSVVDVATGQVVQTYGINDPENGTADDIEDDIIYSFALSKNNELLVTSHRSGLLRMWSVETGTIVKLWKAQHKGPVLKLKFSTCGTLVCSSGADSTLRMWDFANSRCVGVLRDFQGPALILDFHPNASTSEIFAAGANNTIYCWNYTTKQLVRQLIGHLSQVTALSFENYNTDCQYMASVSRDKVLIIWQLDNGAQYKVVPMFEELEGAFFIRGAEETTTTELVVACSSGNLKLVNYKTNKISAIGENPDSAIKFLLHCEQNGEQRLAIVTAEQNILVYHIASKTKLDCVKQLIGFNDEILDICFLGEKERFLAMATNSKNIKLYDTVEHMNCKIIAGHTDIVMTLSSSGRFLLSAGKDLNVLLWRLDVDSFDLVCIAKNGSSHTATIGCISFGFNLPSIFASVSQDGSLKIWNLLEDKSKNYSFNVKFSAISHEKEVNSVTFAPNNKLLATASQDKTAKLWSIDKSTCIGTLRGHTRSVWCVRFSPVDQVILTSSSDCSLRIWSVANLACLKRLEQECSILRAEFLDQGRFIVAASSDGLLKIWSIKTNECVQTMDAHGDRIWCLAASNLSKKYFYSGGADSKLIKWKDVTVESRNNEIDKRKAALEQEQMLQTLLQQHEHMEKALLLALTLGKPKVTYNIIKGYIRQRGELKVKKAISELNADQRASLMEHVKAWSTNSRYTKVANLILKYILTDMIANRSQNLSKHRNFVEVVTPYVQRHFNRVNELSKDLAFLEFIVKCV